MLDHLRRLKKDFPYFCRTCLKINTKEDGIQPLILNRAQEYFYESVKGQLKDMGMVRMVVVKGRQQGLSTIIQALYFWQTIFRVGVNTFILTHEKKATTNLFGMTKRFYDYYPLRDFLQTKEDSSTSLFFEGRESGYSIGTAGNKATGRSLMLQLFHGSEVAYWPHADEHAAGILQSVPFADNTYVIFESTANGIGNFFHHKYTDSLDPESDYELVFIPWYWQPEYSRPVDYNFRIDPDEEKPLVDLFGLTKEQLNWRRHKIRELHTTGVDGAIKFKQEYPNSAEEAFIATSYECYLDVNLIKKAMGHKEYVEAYGPLILGVDPSGVGNDKTAFCLRQGRFVHKIWEINTKDEMEVVGLVVRELRERPIDHCFVDVIGIGAGIVSRLNEIGYGDTVKRVNSAENALNRELYMNLRAEMWAKCKEWLEDDPAVLPDNPRLLNQLVSVGYGNDSKSRLKIESKPDIKKDGRPSPDLADALMYTFARPVNINSNRAIQYPKKMGIC